MRARPLDNIRRRTSRSTPFLHEQRKYEKYREKRKEPAERPRLSGKRAYTASDQVNCDCRHEQVGYVRMRVRIGALVAHHFCSQFGRDVALVVRGVPEQYDRGATCRNQDHAGHPQVAPDKFRWL